MKEFNADKFCRDLVSLRGKESQESFAQKIDVKRSTLSLLENGKQIPTLNILSRVCELAESSIDDYFVDSTSDALGYLMGSLEEADKAEKITVVKETILTVTSDQYHTVEYIRVSFMSDGNIILSISKKGPKK